MKEMQLFEYAIVRVVPRVEREEFINVGVLFFCPSKRYLDFIYELNESRLKALYAEVDMEEVNERLMAMKYICCGDEKRGPIAKLSIASRFRWLAAPKSTIVQTSPVHSGLCHDPQEAATNLLQQCVL